MSKKLTEHKFDIEDSFWFGEKKLQAVGNTLGNQGHEVRFTGGVDEFINAGSSYIQEQSGYLTAPDLNNWLVNAFTYGSEQKVVMAGNMFVKAVNETARGQIRLSNEETKYGIAISTYVTSFGTIKIVRNPRFVGPFSDRAYCLDFADDCLRYRFLANRDTQLKTNVQQPDIDGEVDQYITEAGLEFMEAPRHSLIRGITAA